MTNNQLSRYAWIIDTLRSRGPLTLAELNDLWARTSHPWSSKPMGRRSFYSFRQAIADIFKVDIDVDPSTYCYSINETPEAGAMTDWLMEASMTNDALAGARDLADRIMLENVPSAHPYLQPVVEAMRRGVAVTFDYLPHKRLQVSRSVTVEPWFLRLYRQVWYMVGRVRADGRVKTYALDRMKGLWPTELRFKVPRGLTPQQYFSESLGMMVDDSQAVEVRLRVTPRQARYFAALPLHKSQREELADHYHIFTYRLRLTSDLVAQILSYGPDVEVLAPEKLRRDVAERLRQTLAPYGEGNGGVPLSTAL